MSGIYSITNLINGKRYIGQSTNIQQRFVQHRSNLKKGKGENPHSLNAWNRYGEDNFMFEILLLCDEEDLDKMEKKFIEQYNTTDREYGYNISDGGTSLHHFDDEFKQKLSEQAKRRFQDPEERKRASERAKCRTYSEEGLRAISQRNMERYKDPEARRRMSEACKLSYAMHPERREHLSKILKGRKHGPTTEETKKKLSEAKSYHKTAVIQKDENMNIINEFSSIREAARMTNIIHSSIQKVCHNRQLTAGGYYWKFKQEETDEH